MHFYSINIVISKENRDIIQLSLTKSLLGVGSFHTALASINCIVTVNERNSTVQHNYFKMYLTWHSFMAHPYMSTALRPTCAPAFRLPCRWLCRRHCRWSLPSVAIFAVVTRLSSNLVAYVGVEYV